MTIRRTPLSREGTYELDDRAFSVADAVTSKGRPTRTESESRIPRPTDVQLGTVVEVQTPLLMPASGDGAEAFSLAFDRGIEELGRRMQTYEIVKPHPGFRPITRQTCRWMVPATTRRLDGTYASLTLFMAHVGATQLAVPTADLDSDQLRKFNIVWWQVTARYPFIPFFERVRSAQRACYGDGDYAAVIIAAYTACEVLLNTTLLLIAWEEGMTRADTRDWFEGQLQFMNRVSSQVQTRLEGNWANPPSTSPMGRLLILSDLRQRVAHLTYLPNEAEAQRSLVTLSVLEEFVKESFAVNRHEYPNTRLMLYG